MKVTLKHQLQHKFGKYFHFQDSESTSTSTSTDDSGESEFLSQLMDLVLNDKDISNSLTSGAPLSTASAGKLKAVFANSDFFSNAVFGQLQASEDSQCLTNLNADQKKKFISIILDQMDFSTVFSGSDDQTLTDAQLESIVTAVKADPELSPLLSECIDGLKLAE